MISWKLLSIESIEAGRKTSSIVPVIYDMDVRSPPDDHWDYNDRLTAAE